MNTVKYSRCPICQHETLQPLVQCRDYTVSGEVFEIERCTSCHTGITQGVPDSQNIGKYYQAESYVSHSNTRKGLINKLYHFARSWMLLSKRGLVKDVAGLDKGHILDIGCGTGYFLDTMHRSHWKCTGIEPDENARRFAIEQFKLEVHPPDHLAQLPDHYYDAITLWHVLEHLHDIHGYMKHIDRLLRPDGALIIAVPNYTSYDADHYDSHWAAWDVPRHLWHFTPQSVALLAGQYGFAVELKKMMPFDPFYVSLLSEKYKQSPVKMIGGFFHGFISLLKGMRSVNRASSIIYVLKRKKH